MLFSYHSYASMYVFGKLFGRYAIFRGEPAYKRAYYSVSVKLRRKRRILIVSIILMKILQKYRLQYIAEIILKRILTLYLQRFGIELFIFIKISANRVKMHPAVVLRNIVERVNKFGIKYPVYQIVLITEMIIKALAVHTAAVAYISHTYFRERLTLHKLLQAIGKRALSRIGISHIAFITSVYQK